MSEIYTVNELNLEFTSDIGLHGIILKGVLIREIYKKENDLNLEFNVN